MAVCQKNKRFIGWGWKPEKLDWKYAPSDLINQISNLMNRKWSFINMYNRYQYIYTSKHHLNVIRIDNLSHHDFWQGSNLQCEVMFDVKLDWQSCLSGCHFKILDPKNKTKNNIPNLRSQSWDIAQYPEIANQSNCAILGGSRLTHTKYIYIVLSKDLNM